MTKTIDALVEALQEIVRNDPYKQSSGGTIARAALAQAHAEQAEPVAWIEPRDLEALAMYSKQCQVTLFRESSGKRVSLHTTPPAAPVAKLEPLSDAEIENATGAKQGTPMFIVARGFTEAIEAAHNAKLGNK